MGVICERGGGVEGWSVIVKLILDYVIDSTYTHILIHETFLPTYVF